MHTHPICFVITGITLKLCNGKKVLHQSIFLNIKRQCKQTNLLLPYQALFACKDIEC